jgi:hypothetical protein
MFISFFALIKKNRVTFVLFCEKLSWFSLDFHRLFTPTDLMMGIIALTQFEYSSNKREEASQYNLHTFCKFRFDYIIIYLVALISPSLLACYLMNFTPH